MANNLDELVDRRRSDSEKWRRYGEEVLPLWVADMDFRSPEPVIRALRERVEHGVFGYGCEPPELRGVLVERLQKLYGWSVPADALVFLPGVVVGFNLVCRALVGPDDGVLVQTPVYGPIHRAPALAGLASHSMELTRGPDGHYGVDLDAMERAVNERTRMFLLCSPHNPVGRVFRREELMGMAEVCLRHDLLICSDDIHCDLVFRGHPHLPIASLAREVAERTITLMAPSKTFNIAGLHFGVAIIENAELRKRFEEARRGLVPTPDVLSCTAALAAYREGQPWLDQVLAYLEANRDYLVEYVRANLPGIRVTVPEGTYLAWLDCRGAALPTCPQQFFLERAQVALNDGAWFGRGGEGFVRLNFGCPRSILVEALERMRKALERR